MSGRGHGAQVVKVREDHTYELDERELESVLLRDGIKDLPVVVVSVAGPYRSGKSFLLNFFLRYLTSSPSARQDGSWLGESSEPLVGFSWSPGSKRNTTGILLWSEPILMTLPTGENVAVLLMDTQGTFDSTSTVRDCSTVFALSTLLSSVQIYNLRNNIHEDDLEHLQLFTEYGRMVADEQGSKAFQTLEFLVRDWLWSEEYAYGATGGGLYLREKLKIKPTQAQEMRDLRTNITTCFEKVSCFLMPHPGLRVLNNRYDGKISDMDSEFKKHLKDLVSSIFSPEKLMPKRVHGELVRARDMCTYFKTYMGLFNSDKIPSPSTIMEATVRAGLLAAADEARAVYELGMQAECGPGQPSLPASDLQDLHDKYLAKATAAFTTKNKMGDANEANNYLDKLTKDLGNELPLYRQRNVAKTQDAVNRGNEAYEAAISAVTHGNMLCLHPTDLLRVHRQAYDAATEVFDASRKRISNKKDVERELFLKSIEIRYRELRELNEQNHNINAVTLRMQYSDRMLNKIVMEPLISQAELNHEHNDALNDALKKFDTNMNIPSQHTEDLFKFILNQDIIKTFLILKKINGRPKRASLRAGLQAYNEYIAGAWNSQTEFMHPLAFKSYDDTGRCRALVAFRPRKICQQGFTSDDEDEQILADLIDQRYNEMKKVNDSANESAVQEAYRYYYNRMEELRRSTENWSLDEKVKHHNNVSREAVKRFREKQLYADLHSENHYEDKLLSMMNKEL